MFSEINERRYLEAMTIPSKFKEMGYLSTGDVAKKMVVHRTTVWHWIKNGLLPSTQVTPRFRGVTAADLAQFQSNFVPDAPAVSAKKKPPSKKATKKATKKVAKKTTKKKARR